MSYRDAIRDGIKMCKSGAYTYYMVECHKCGKEMKVIRYSSGTRYTCDDCKNKIKQIEDEYRALKKQRQFDSAVNILHKQIKYNKGNQKQYKDAIMAVEQKINAGCKFDSKEEILVAIMLEKSKIKYSEQVKIGKYRIDFVIPNMKIILEVDGRCYHGGTQSDEEKDFLMQSLFGKEWKIVRISDDVINRNILYLDEFLYEMSSDKYLYDKYTNRDLEYEDIAFSHSMQRYTKRY